MTDFLQKCIDEQATIPRRRYRDIENIILFSDLHQVNVIEPGRWIKLLLLFNASNKYLESTIEVSMTIDSELSKCPGGWHKPHKRF